MFNFVPFKEVKTKIKISKLYFKGCKPVIPVALLLRVLAEHTVHHVVGIKTVLYDVPQQLEVQCAAFLPIYCMCVTVKSGC